ncbi:MAG: nitrilase-related carbon-nitrogen hydrolase [Oscillospiraceae bacterium]
MKDGFYRIAAATPPVRVADCEKNKMEIKKLIEKAAGEGAAAVIFPELSLTGYTCADLFKQKTLLRTAEQNLRELIAETKKLDILCAVGVPVPYKGALYNCVAVFKDGELLGLPAKKISPITMNFTSYVISHPVPTA